MNDTPVTLDMLLTVEYGVKTPLKKVSERYVAPPSSDD